MLLQIHQYYRFGMEDLRLGLNIKSWQQSQPCLSRGKKLKSSLHIKLNVLFAWESLRKRILYVCCLTASMFFMFSVLTAGSWRILVVLFVEQLLL
ncbi:hypothetical protein PTKIN_Ptkin13bG0257800 [Pterospermum kingtungense]